MDHVYGEGIEFKYLFIYLKIPLRLLFLDVGTVDDSHQIGKRWSLVIVRLLRTYCPYLVQSALEVDE